MTKADLKILNAIDALICDAHERLDAYVNEKREAFDEKSDRWKEGDKGQEAEAAISELEETRDDLEAVRDRLQGQFERD